MALLQALHIIIGKWMAILCKQEAEEPQTEVILSVTLMLMLRPVGLQGTQSQLDFMKST